MWQNLLTWLWNNFYDMQEEGMVRGLELENAVADADYTKAIQISFKLRRPHKLFELFAEVCRYARSSCL